ncbi:MAG: hypothetical protein V4628_14945 [Pseudomonadota bacterium]
MTESSHEKELHDRQRRFQLARLITLSEEMLEHAKAGTWSAVEEMEVIRRVELEECFAMQHEQPSLLIAQALATLIHINEQIVMMVRQARDQVSRDHAREVGMLQGIQAYQQGSV